MSEEKTDKRSPEETDCGEGSEAAETTVGIEFAGPLELKPGQTVAERYTVIEEIGRGGMGVVYKVNHIALSRQLALKTIDATNISDAVWRRFQQEAKAMSLLDHPNLITVHDFGLVDGKHPYFVMDLVEGKTLAERIATNPLKVEEALPIMIQVCFGLAYAHDLGIVHRDMKPSNIMLSKTEIGTANSTVKIVDFGIAKLHLSEASETQGLTRTGEIFGSPLYMSPEQCMGLPVDHRSDIYAIGCVFFEALTGVPPFQGNSALSTMMMHQTQKIPTLKEVTLGKEFPSEIEKMVARLLAKEPDQRYQSLKAVARDLSLLQQGMEAQAFTGVTQDPEKEATGRTVPLYLAVICCLALMTVSGSVCWYIKGNIDADNLRTKLKELANTPIPMPPAQSRAQDEPEFTRLETHNGELCRRFDFGQYFGKYTLCDVPFSTKIAKGIAYVPVHHPVKLRVEDLIAVNSPRFFFRFQPDDLAELDFGNNFSATDTTFEHISHLKTLRALYAQGIDITNNVLNEFDHMPNLKILYLNRTQIRQNGLVKLKYLREYQGLGLSRLGPMDRVLKKLRGSTALSSLELDGCDLTDDDLKDVGTFSNLTDLNLEHNPKLTNAGFKHLLALKNLHCLRISGTQINSNIIPDLKQFSKMETLYVYPDLWSPKDVARVKQQVPDLDLAVDDDAWKRDSGQKPRIEVPMGTIKHIFDKNPVTKH